MPEKPEIYIEGPEQRIPAPRPTPAPIPQGGQETLLLKALAGLAARGVRGAASRLPAPPAPPEEVFQPNESQTFDLPEAKATGATDLTPGGLGLRAGLKQAQDPNKFIQGLVHTAMTSPQAFGGLLQELGERAEEDATDEDIIKGFQNFKLGTPVPFGPAVFKRMKADIFKNTDMDEKLTKASKGLIERNKTFVKKAFPGFEDPGETFGEKLAYNLGSGVTTLAGAMGITIATGSPMAASVLFGGYQKGELYKEMRERGIDPEKAGTVSTVGGVVEGSLEFLGLQFMLSKLSKNFMADIIAHAIAESGQEFAQTLGENVIMQTAGGRVHAKFTDFFAGAGMAALVGAILGGSVNTVTTLAERSGVIKELEDLGYSKEKAKKAAYPVLKAMKKRAEVAAQYVIMQEQARNAQRGPSQQAQGEIPLPGKLRSKLIEDFVALNEKLGERGSIDIVPGGKEKRIISDAEMEKLEAAGKVKSVIRGKKTKAVIQKTTGVTDTSEKVVQSEKTALKKQIRDKAQASLKAARYGFEQGILEAKGTRKALKEALEEYVHENADGNISDDVMDALGEVETETDLLKAFSKADELIQKHYLNEKPQTQSTKAIVRETTGQTDKSESVELSERDLLRAQMKSKAQASKYGYREGYRDARRNLIEKLYKDKQGIKERKAALHQYIHNSAPAGLKRGLLSMVNAAQTNPQIVKTLLRAEDIIQKHQRKEAVREVKALFDKADSAKSISVEYRELIQGIENEINFKSPRQETINRLRKTKAWITKQMAAGKDVTVPNRIYLAVQSLEKTSIHDLALEDIYVLYDTLDTMISLGTVKEQNRRSAFIAERGQIQKQLLEAPTQKVETKDMIERIEKLTPAEGATNLYRTAMNKLQALDLNISPMDAVFDMFDKGANYTGAWYMNFKRRVDINFGRFLGEIWAEKDEAAAKVKSLDLDETNFRRIGVFAARSQASGMEKLINNGLTEAEINAIVLSPKEKEFYDYMRSKLDAMLPRIKDMMATVFNEEVGEVENYFPFMTDFEALNELEAAQRLFDSEDRARLQSKPNLQFTQERKGAGRQKIRINAYDTFLNHMENAHYAVNMAYTDKMLAEILQDPDIERKIGLRGKTIIKQWLDVVNKKGGASGQQYIKGLDVLRHNLGVATLGFRLSSAAIQPTALLDGAALIGGYAFQGAQDIALSSKWRKLVAQFPEIKDRVGDDPAFRERSTFAPMEKLQQSGMAPLRYLDGKTAAAVAAGAYRKFMKDKNRRIDFKTLDQEAMQYAQMIVRRSQASSSFKDSPLAISRGKLLERFENKSLARLVLQYQTFMLQRWSRLRRDLPNQLKNKEYGAAAQNFLFWQTAILTEILVRNASKDAINALFGIDGDDDRDFLKQYFGTLFQTVPFVGQAISAIYYKSIPIPLVEQLARIRDDFRNFDRSTKSEAMAKWGTIAALDLVGGFAGIPGSMQVSTVLRQRRLKSTKKKIRL